MLINNTVMLYYIAELKPLLILPSCNNYQKNFSIICNFAALFGCDAKKGAVQSLLPEAAIPRDLDASGDGFGVMVYHSTNPNPGS
jgi:hypothetical protein